MKTEMNSSFAELTGTSKGRRLLEQESALVAATEMIAKLMEERKVSRAELARRLGKSKAFVTIVLRGPRNMTLRTLADLAWALGSRVRFQPADWIDRGKRSSAGVLSPEEGASKGTKRATDAVVVLPYRGGWAVKRPHAQRASAICDTQTQAIHRARELAGQGAIRIQGRNGKPRHQASLH